MMFYSRMFFLLLLMLGLVGCPDDSEEGDDAKYTLKVAKPSSAAVGADVSVEVKLYKGDAIVKDDDAKAAKDADVTGSIKCKEHSDKVAATKGKFDAAGKATLTINIADNSDKTATAAGTKGYTDCVVSAATEFGDDKTKASGDSEKFAVTAKGAGNNDTGAVKKPELPSAGILEGTQFEVTNGVGAVIKLVNDSNACAAADDGKLFKITMSSGTPSVPSLSEVSGDSTKIADGDIFFVMGQDCDLKVGDLDAADVKDRIGTAPTIGAITTSTSLGFSVANPDSVTGNPKWGFVKKGSGNWTRITTDFPEGASPTDWVQTGLVPSTTSGDIDQVLFGVNGQWSHSTVTR